MSNSVSGRHCQISYAVLLRWPRCQHQDQFAKKTRMTVSRPGTVSRLNVTINQKVKVFETSAWFWSWSQSSAVSPQVTEAVNLVVLSVGPAVTSQAADYHHPLAGTKLNCLVIEAHVKTLEELSAVYHWHCLGYWHQRADERHSNPSPR